MIDYATHTDIPAIVDLLNSAYRGERSTKGWTTEAHLIAGEVRSDATQVGEVMDKEGSVFLKYVDENGQMKGCMNLQNNERGVYLGMFSVEPELQGAGIGKKLLMAADEHARKIGASHIYMYVISLRQELINWYKRYGFEETGEQFPFAEDGLTGKHLQPLEFIVLEKVLD